MPVKKTTPKKVTKPKVIKVNEEPIVNEVQHQIKYDFDDILLQTEVLTDISSRYSKVYPFLQFNNTSKLPLFTAPMDTVIDSLNANDYKRNNINLVYPRTESFKLNTDGFNSFSLNEFEDELSNMNPTFGKWHVLIDVANGHMKKILDCAKRAKKINPEIIIMAGNIANPETYRKYCESDAIDFVRVGIGNGNGCLTTQQTGVGYPMASLIIECNKIKKEYKNPTKIVADGGMKKYSDIIKALALGADYVMVGSIFNKALESASPNYWYGIKLPESIAKWMFKKGFKLTKEFRGMSTKKSQKLLGNKILRTSEGVVKTQRVEYTIQQWAENFESYLRTTMSYSDCYNLDDFIGKIKWNLISQNALNRYNK